MGQLASGVTELDGGLTLVLPDKKALGPKGRVTVRAPAGTILLQQPLDMTRLDEVLTLDIPTIPVPALRLPMVDYEEI